MTAPNKPISSTAFGLYERSPRLYKAWDAGEYQRADTPAMMLGRLTHAMILLPEQVDHMYAVRPEGIDRRTKAGKAAWEDFVASVGDREIITAEQRATAERLRDAVLENPTAAGLLEQCPRRESQLTWQHEGIACGGRVDAWGSDVLLDLKTTDDPSPSEFARKIHAYRYDRQLAWYRDGLRTLGHGDPMPILIVVAKSDPHDVAIYRLPDAWLDHGLRSAHKLRREIHDRWERNAWTSIYEDQITQIDAPRWVQLDDEPLSLTVGGEGIEL